MTDDDVEVVKVTYMVLNALLKPAYMVSEPAMHSEAFASDAGTRVRRAAILSGADLLYTL